MGRMNDALRKAAEERERKRRQSRESSGDGGSTAAPGAPAVRESVPASERRVEPLDLDTESRSTTLAARPDLQSEPVERAEPVDRTEPVADSGASRSERARAKVRRERTDEKVEDAAPAVGERPAAAPAVLTDEVDPRVICFHAPRHSSAEQMRGVRTTLLTMDTPPKSVAVTSGSQAEGKSLACANLAASLVEGGSRRVLLVDANLRHPELIGIVAAKDGLGLSDLMRGCSADPVALVQETGMPGVDILGAGQSLDNPGSLLNPKALAGVLGILEESYDCVIVDTPALDEYADAAVMAPEVDGAILVCAVEGPPRAAAEKALDLLESARTRVLGILATNCG